MVEPTIEHVIKAVAWDAMYAALQIEIKTNPLNVAYPTIKIMMDQHIERTGKVMSDPNTHGGKK